MELIAITENIKSKFKNAGMISHIEEIDKRIEAGSHGMEITLNVGKYLMDLREKDKNIEDLVGSDIDLYIADCKTFGLDIL